MHRHNHQHTDQLGILTSTVCKASRWIFRRTRSRIVQLGTIQNNLRKSLAACLHTQSHTAREGIPLSTVDIPLFGSLRSY